MDPLTIGIGLAGLGMSLFGGAKSSSDSSQIAQQQKELAQQSYGINSNISGLENQVNDQHQTQMELTSRRASLENFRNTQKAQAQGLTNATNQGAQFGSGMQGGQAEVADQGMFNDLGIKNNLEIGENIFGLNRQISKQKLDLSALQTKYAGTIGDLQSSLATDQGISSFGKSLSGSASMFGNMAQGMGGFKMNIPGFNPFAGMTGQ